MNSSFKSIHIGSFVKQRVVELEIETSRICSFFKCGSEEIEQMFLQKELSTDILLKWSKFLQYDFFRIYTQHLIFYSPQESMNYNNLPKEKKSRLPQFRKNIYTKEVIDFILELISNGEKTKHQVIEEYKIPKTTLYKWISKYDSKK